MLRTLTYAIEEPLFYAATEVDISQATLIQIELSDEKGNVLRDEYFDPEGTASSIEISKYSEDGKLLSCETFMGDSKEAFRKRVLEYTEQGEIKKESIFFEGQLTGGQLCHYDADGKLSKVIASKEGQPEIITVYQWHKIIPGSCIREEISADKVLTEIITREWELKDGKPFLTEEYSSRIDKPEESRVARFYDGKEMENGVAFELYNGQGNLLEEVREEYDFHGRVQRAAWHTDDFSWSTPYKEEIYEYDAKDRVVLFQSIVKGSIVHLTKNLYDENGRLVRCLSKSNMDTHVFFYVHENVH